MLQEIGPGQSHEIYSSESTFAKYESTHPAILRLALIPTFFNFSLRNKLRPIWRYTPLSGAQIRYIITAGKQIVPLTGFGAAAWQTAPRDKFIGWNHDQREKNLNLITNNARFLILPWVKSKNLALRILLLIARRLPDDWEEKYNIRPVLLESFVQKNLFSGTRYKAATGLMLDKPRAVENSGQQEK